MTMNTISDSSVEIEWRRNVMERVFKHFDEDGDGRIAIQELKSCLTNCYGIYVDDEAMIRSFLPMEQDNKIEISRILQALDGDHDNNLLFQNLQKLDYFDLSLALIGLRFNNMQGRIFSWVKSEEEDHVVIDIKQLNISLPPVTDEYSDVSKLRNMFLGLTGQAAASFVAYASASARPLHVVVAANALAFLLLLLSLWLRGRNLVTAERVMGLIGISLAVLVIFLMMGMVIIPVKTM